MQERELHKYWYQRRCLFHRFDDGVALDRDGWFSVTPEAIAAQQAARCMAAAALISGGASAAAGPASAQSPSPLRAVVVDAFAGVGGNAIQFALAGAMVIAVEMDAGRLQMIAHNAGVYGVADRVLPVRGDFLALAPRLRADVLFLSPPWGGPGYLASAEYDVAASLLPVGLDALLAAARSVAPAVAAFLPRNSGLQGVLACGVAAGVPLAAVERNLLDGRLKAITAYFGEPFKAVFA